MRGSPGSGTTEFGSGEPPDFENWKVIMTLRGYTADVVYLNWSPDDSMLASGTLDNTIHTWNMSNGICTAVLRGQCSLVKGVTWDPIGSFIASQSDDKTVIIWKTSNRSLAHRTEDHWAKSLGSTFFRRLGWSPCGHFINTTHGFQKQRHSAPVLERGEWSATFDFLGHNAPIIVVKFNHSMFKRKFTNAQEGKSASVGWANGASKTVRKEPQPYNIIAIGSQDQTITVWTTASPRPLFVLKNFFTQSVVDLSWSPDGYSLFACSLDGTVATFHFEVKELGHQLSDGELDDLKRNRYGDVRGRQENFAESPAQLLLEAASAKQAARKKVSLDVQQNRTLAKSSAHVGVMMNASESHLDDLKKSGGAAADNLNKVSMTTQLPGPVKQIEYRRPDGRKWITPEAVGVPSQQENTSMGAQSQSLEFHQMSSDQRRNGNNLVVADSGVRENSFRGTLGRFSDMKERYGPTARAMITESLVIEKVAASTSSNECINVEQTGNVKACNSLGSASSILSIRVFDKKEWEDTVPLFLEVQPWEQAANDVFGMGYICITKETEITCTRGSQSL